MKGSNPSVKQKKYHDLLCQRIGCVACLADGIRNHHVSVHHVDGRTKPMAHWLVLPLCGPHHQDQGIDGVVAVHPYKAQFQARYGRQLDLIEQCARSLEEMGVELPDPIRELTGIVAA